MVGEALHERILGTEALSRGLLEADGRTYAEAGIRPRFGPDVPFRVAHARIHLWIDPEAPVLRGEATLRIEPLPAGMGAVVLDLDSVEVSEVTGPEGLSWSHREARLHLSGLPAEGAEVTVRYAGRPARGLYFVGATPAEPDRRPMAWTQCQDEDGHHVFPCVDHPRIKHPWTLVISAPAHQEVVSNGFLASCRSDADGWRTWTWEQAEPMPAYLVNVIVGELDIYEGEGQRIRYLVPRGTDPSAVERAFHKTPAMVAQLGERLGVAYPWPRYDQIVVHDFIFGGMENVAATTMTDLMLTTERASLDYSFDDLVSHELMHQWFGDLLTCQDWSQAWLNEGWATYGESLWKVHDKGADEADLHRWGWLQRYLGEHASRYHRPLVLWDYRNPIDLFDRHLYEKGALVIHTLRSTLGESGFWAGVTRYLDHHRHGAVHTRDFQAAMEWATGRNLDAFFQAYVTGTGHPVLKVSVAHADDLLTVTVAQTQEGPGIAERFEVALPLAIESEDGTRTEVRLPLRERRQVFTLPCSQPPTRVEVDPHFSVLADLRLDGPVDLLAASLKDDPGVVGRIRAARGLLEDGGPKARRIVCEALAQDPFWGVRASLAGALSKAGGAEVRAALLARLADEPHPKARAAVVGALATQRHPDVFAALARVAVDGDPALSVEGGAAKALGSLQAPQTVDVCRTLLTRDSWAEVLRMGALQGLGSCRDEAALDDLIAWSQPHRPVRCQVAACAALGQLAWTLAAVRPTAVARLSTLAQEGEFRVRLAAIGALGRSRTPSAAGLLHRIHTRDMDGRVARTAYEARARLQASSADPTTSLRRELDELRAAHQALRDRLDRLDGADPPQDDASVG